MRSLFLCVTLLASLLVGRAPAVRAADAPPVDYARDVLPILETYCIGCHTADDANGDLVLDAFGDLMKGGEHGPAITAGEPDSSRLFLMAAGRMEPVMPPDGMEGPNETELALLQLWIEQGAPGPKGDVPLRRTLRTPTIPRTATAPLPVTALAVSPDGLHMAVARFDRVEIMAIDGGSTLRTLAEQPGKVNDLRFSTDGTLLAVASGLTGAYGQATVFRVSDGEPMVEVVGHRDTLYAAAISPSGEFLATAGYDAEVLLWEISSGERIRAMSGHNGAVFDLAFSPDGSVLATASADETVKIWKVSSGERLDTLSQPQGEVWTVAFTPNGEQIVAGSADNQFRVWRFTSKERPQTNPLIQTRFADETPLLRLAFTPEGKCMIVASAAGHLMMFDTESWNKVADLPDAPDMVSEVAVHSGGDRAVLGAMDGTVRWIDLPSMQQKAATPQKAPVPPGSTVRAATQTPASEPQGEVYLDIEQLTELDETTRKDNRTAADAMPLPRGANVGGILQATEDGSTPEDWFRFEARQGEVWMIETKAARDGSPLDSVVAVVDADDQPILRARLQAVHESYFTFRGKNSAQSNDFRLFDWQAMELNDYLYSAGEVTRLWMYPRGPDSGFNVYPGTGNRWTYFGTTPITHALQEPAYVVRELAPGEPPISNGLPVFEIPYQNDDDASRQIGTDSRLRFTAPADGVYKIKLRDTRGFGGNEFKYQLTLRPASPGFEPTVSKIDKPIPAGAGREFRVSIVRNDGYQGPVRFEIAPLSDGLHVTESVTIEAGQNEAYGVVWADADVAAGKTFAAPEVVARAEILGRVVERAAGNLGELKTAARPQVTLSIRPDSSDASAPASNDGVLRIRPGQTIAAVVHLNRAGNDDEIRLGNEFAGRNMPHGVFVDNIGLSGLIVLAGENEQQFFITAAPIAAPGPRSFHLKASIDGGVTSVPVQLEVVAPDSETRGD